MKNEVISLVSKTYTKDAKGVSRATETVKEDILCEVKSARASEWFDGGRNDINPTYTFVIRQIEYAGEETVIYKGERHAVYRTYINGDQIELHVQKEKGA